MKKNRPKRILAVASGGGHWVQLLRMREAFADHDVVYVTTDAGYRGDVAPSRLRVVVDANRWQKVRMVRLLLQMAWVVFRERPDVVVTTGAAPGILAIRLGRLVGAKCVWVDSIANCEEMSLSGRMALKHADVCLTQWEHLAGPGAGEPRYEGAVL